MSNTAEFEQAVGTEKGGHPVGLYVLGAEMWERFSYYGMRALLVLYLTKHLSYARKDALEIYANYTGLVYLTPLLGGLLADWYLGQRKAILIGGLLMALGHFAMAFESLLTMALGLLILGNGFFKPNISTMVGQLYPQNDSRRDSAYTIFYMGINLGAFFSPLVCGSLGESVGWHYGFGAAGVGMLFGLAVFAAMQRHLGRRGYPPQRSDRAQPRLGVADMIHVAALTAFGVALVYVAERTAPAIYAMVPPFGWVFVVLYLCVLGVVAVIVTAVVTRIGVSRTGGTEGSIDDGEPSFADDGKGAGDDTRSGWFSGPEVLRILVILIVAVFSIVFWMGFEQAGGTFTLFADQKTNRVVLGHAFPASWYQSVNPLLILLLAPLFSILWTALDRTRFALPSTAKMGVGMILLGVGFVVMMRAESLASRMGKVGPEWLALVYLFNTMGELCLSPIGLSLVNKLAPARIASLMMAVWFMSTAFANYAAGMLEAWLWHTTFDLWTFLIFTSMVPGVIVLALTPVFRRMSHGRI